MDLEKGTFISSVFGSPIEEYYLGKNSWSATASDWKQRFEVGNAIIDPAGDWDPSSAETYIDTQIATVTGDLASEVVARQAADTNIQSQIPLADEEDLTKSGSYLKFKDRIYNQVSPNGMGKVILRNNIVNGVNTLTQSMINQANTIYVIQYDFFINTNEELNSITIDDSSSVVIRNFTFYIKDIIVPAGKKLTILNKDCYLIAQSRYLLDFDFVVAKNEATTYQIGVKSTGTINNAYKIEDLTIIPNNCILQFEGGSLISGVLCGDNTNIISTNTKIFGDSVCLHGSWNTYQICPEWFGAKGDGTSDDTDAIQRSFNNAYYSRINKIKFANKQYRVTNTIYMMPDNLIEGTNNDDCINPFCSIIADFSNPMNYVFVSYCISRDTNEQVPVGTITEVFKDNNNLPHVSIKNLYITTNTLCLGAIYLYCSQHGVFENIKIFNFEVGISGSNLWGNTFNNITCRHCNFGFVFRYNTTINTFNGCHASMRATLAYDSTFKDFVNTFLQNELPNDVDCGGFSIMQSSSAELSGCVTEYLDYGVFFHKVNITMNHYYIEGLTKHIAMFNSGNVIINGMTGSNYVQKEIDYKITEIIHGVPSMTMINCFPGTFTSLPGSYAKSYPYIYIINSKDTMADAQFLDYNRTNYIKRITEVNKIYITSDENALPSDTKLLGVSPSTAISFTTLKARGLDNGDYNTVKTLYINDNVVLNTAIIIPREMNIVIKEGKTLTLGDEGTFVFTGEGKLNLFGGGATGGTITLQNNTNNKRFIQLNTYKTVDVFFDNINFATSNSSFYPIIMAGWGVYPKLAINITYRCTNCTFTNNIVGYLYSDGCTESKVIYENTKLTYQNDGKYVVPQV